MPRAEAGDADVVQAKITWIILRGEFQCGVCSGGHDDELPVGPCKGRGVGNAVECGPAPIDTKLLDGTGNGIIEPKRNQIALAATVARVCERVAS